MSQLSQGTQTSLCGYTYVKIPVYDPDDVSDSANKKPTVVTDSREYINLYLSYRYCTTGEENQTYISCTPLQCFGYNPATSQEDGLKLAICDLTEFPVGGNLLLRETLNDIKESIGRLHVPIVLYMNKELSEFGDSFDKSNINEVRLVNKTDYINLRDNLFHHVTEASYFLYEDNLNISVINGKDLIHTNGKITRPNPKQIKEKKEVAALQFSSTTKSTTGNSQCKGQIDINSLAGDLEGINREAFFESFKTNPIKNGVYSEVHAVCNIPQEIPCLKYYTDYTKILSDNFMIVPVDWRTSNGSVVRTTLGVEYVNINSVNFYLIPYGIRDKQTGEMVCDSTDFDMELDIDKNDNVYNMTYNTGNHIIRHCEILDFDFYQPKYVSVIEAADDGVFETQNGYDSISEYGFMNLGVLPFENPNSRYERVQSDYYNYPLMIPMEYIGLSAAIDINGNIVKDSNKIYFLASIHYKEIPTEYFAFNSWVGQSQVSKSDCMIFDMVTLMYGHQRPDIMSRLIDRSIPL